MKDGLLAPRRARHTLSTGILDLEIAAEAPDGLFRVAERQNPKRAFLFVSTVLGRHIPVAPAAHRAALTQLADRVAAVLGTGDVLVMSYAETAIGLGLGVFDALCCRDPARRIGYLPTTRFAPRSLTSWFEMEEAHSHAVDHMIFAPAPGILPRGGDTTLVIVDDETTTGSTFRNLAAGLASRGFAPDKIVLATLTDWSGGQAAAAVASAVPAAYVVSVALLTGRWSWQPDATRVPQELPPGTPPACPRWTPNPDSRFTVPRTGLRGDDLLTLRSAVHETVDSLLLPRLPHAARVLVVGTGEHVWHPFLAAERIAAAGHTVGFIATTRSPVAPGPVIARQLTFPDHYGLGLTMYLNNVAPSDWDSTVLFTETGLDGVPPDLREALGQGWIVTDTGAVAPLAEGGQG